MIDIRRAIGRFHTQIGWLESWHSFSFGDHYDPENVQHGLLRVLNDDIVSPGMGFGTHPHRDMEIVTWVLSGELEHKDSEGNHGVIYPGLAQRMSAGSGIFHSEMNHSKVEPVHLIQMWVMPDTMSIKPGYEQKDINKDLARGGLVPIASGKGHENAVKIHQKGAVLWGGRLKPGESVQVPDSFKSHVFIAEGAAQLQQNKLQEGDAARLTEEKSISLTADAKSGTEVLIWQLGK